MLTFWKFSRSLRKVEPPISFSASCHEGFGHGFSGSCTTTSILRWNSNVTQSIMRMIRCGGLASLRTVEICAGLMVLRAASASARAGLAASSLISADALST